MKNNEELKNKVTKVLKNNAAKFYPDSTWNDGAFCLGLILKKEWLTNKKKEQEEQDE